MDIIKRANELSTITDKKEFCHRLMDLKQAWGVLRWIQMSVGNDSHVILSSETMQKKGWSWNSVLEYLDAMFNKGLILPKEQTGVIDFRKQCEEEIRIHNQVSLVVYDIESLGKTLEYLQRSLNASEAQFGVLFPDSGLLVRPEDESIELSYRCSSTTKTGKIFRELCLLVKELKPGTPYSLLELDWRSGSLEDKQIKEQFRQAVLSFNAVCKEELHIDVPVLAYDGKNNQISRRHV